MLPKRIAAIGASTCEGGVDPEGGGYVGRLRRWLETMDQHYHVYNLGISGEITAQILKRIPVEIPPREPDLIIFGGGSNDTIHVGSPDNPPQTSEETFRKNITAIINKASQLAENVLVVGANIIDDTNTQPTPWRKEHSFVLKDVEHYAQITKEICQGKEVDYLDVWSEWEKKDYKKFLHTDGLHPNPAGHEKIFGMIKNYLQQKFK